MSIHIPQRAVIRQTLANGTTLLFAPNPYNQIVAIRVFSRLGSRHEPAEKAGLANLGLTLLPAGTTRHSEDQIAGNLEKNGAQFKAEAGKDRSTVDLQTTTRCLREDLETVLELLDYPTFPEDKLEREREVVRMNILEQDDSRLHFTMRIFCQHYYGSHPYSWPSLGRIETLDAIQRDGLAAFAGTAFDPANLVVSVVGGEENGEVMEIVAEAFGARPARAAAPVPDCPPAAPAVHEDAMILEHRETEAEYVVAGYPGCGLREPDMPSLLVISALLGGSMDSRLFKEIRDKRGLCYQVGASYSPHYDHTPLLLYTVLSPANRDEALRCMEMEIERLKNEPTPEDELQRVKTCIGGHYVMAMETNMGQASCYGKYETAGLGWEYANRFPEAVQAVTAEDILNAARKWFTCRLLAITAPPAH
ncbi:MAG: M16 family metallopeptidase [bacterium]